MIKELSSFFSPFLFIYHVSVKALIYATLGIQQFLLAVVVILRSISVFLSSYADIDSMSILDVSEVKVTHELTGMDSMLSLNTSRAISIHIYSYHSQYQIHCKNSWCTDAETDYM